MPFLQLVLRMGEKLDKSVNSGNVYGISDDIQFELEYLLSALSKLEFGIIFYTMFS